MKACEATYQDLDALRARIERRPISCILPPERAGKAWAGQEDMDLYINILDRKTREKQFQKDTDEVIAMAGSGKRVKDESGRISEGARKRRMRDYGCFYLGMAAGGVLAALTLQLLGLI